MPREREFTIDAAPLLTRGRVQNLVLRRMSKHDYYAVDALRGAQRQWLQPWDATAPYPGVLPEFPQYVRQQLRATRRGDCLPLVLVADGQLIGQIIVSDIVRGAAWTGSIGYWIAQEWGGNGIMSAAVAATIDICFAQLHLHRVEICIRPENQRSLGVVAKLGLREEGLRRAYLHINGAWADHRCFAIVAEEVPQAGVLAEQIRSASRRICR